MTTLTFLLILIFLIGLYFYAKYPDPKYSEGLTNNSINKPRCPNLLIQKGSRFFLYNSKVAQVPGVNPIEFENLEDYTEFLDWQRSQGIRCPVLYLQQSYDAQGNRVYKVRPSVSEPQGGLPPSPIGSTQTMPTDYTSTKRKSGFPPSSESPIGVGSQNQPNEPVYTEGDLAYPNPTLLVDATRNDPPYNKNSYPGYDETDFYVGRTTPLDEMNYKQEQANVSANPMDPNWGGASYTQNLVDKGFYKNNNVSIMVGASN